MRHSAPSAEHVACAVVAACTQHPDENPLDVAGGVEGRFKSRHFALHGLIEVFPQANPRDLARLVGFHRHVGAFLAGSMRMCGGTRRVNWWSALILRDVVAAIRAAPAVIRPVQSVAAVPSPDVASKVQSAPAASVAPRRVVVPSEAVERPPAPVAVARRTPHPMPGAGSKQALRDMLAEAVRNTAAKTPPADG